MALLDRPKRVYPVLVVMVLGMFALSAVGNSTSHNPTHGIRYTIGAIGWFGFLVSALATLLYSLALAIHRARHSRRLA